MNLHYQLVVTTFLDSILPWLLNDIIIRDYGDININHVTLCYHCILYSELRYNIISQNNIIISQDGTGSREHTTVYIHIHIDNVDMHRCVDIT